jgi:transposase InsO family protein
MAAQGFSYVLTMMDRTSRWPEAVPLANIAAETCADAFVSGWVSRHGVPHTVTTDRGTQFVSSTWQCLARKLGFRHITTTSYHPQANGMVERLHRQIKDLRARQCGTAWLEHLPWTLLGLRAAPKVTVGSPQLKRYLGSHCSYLGSCPWTVMWGRLEARHRLRNHLAAFP